ncbi:MAG: class I SAM-dependent RNA methyltransferase [bacterium]|nr:MAG: class I SAM-dependent RNA methyltransferase [bacterium]
MSRGTRPDTVTPGVEIRKMVPGGSGLAFLDGNPLFVPLTAPGDVVIPERVRAARGVLFAQPGSILTSSPDRVEPPCPWFGRCGGCSWMHLRYEAQLRWKGSILLEALRGIGSITADLPIAVRESPVTLGYRYRARLRISGGRAGFLRRGSGQVVAWDRCRILPDGLNEAVSTLRSLLDSAGGPPGRSVPVSCEVAMSPVDGAVSFLWDVERRRGSRSHVRALMDRLEGTARERGLEVAGQAARDGRGKLLLRRGGGIRLDAAGALLLASPGTFFQVNPAVNGLLVLRVMELLGERGTSSLLDLYCGNGNFSIPAALRGMDVLGVEASAPAVADAETAAAAGSTFRRMDVADFLARDSKSWDAAVLDPPRAGLPAPVTRLLTARKVPVLVYVSCEPSTLARDLARLTSAGYSIRRMELVDMFPQTFHAETLVVLER